LFNHSRANQNVGWTRDINRKVIVYQALRDIQAGEELCISYGDHLTFVDADETVNGTCAASEPEAETEALSKIQLGQDP
jgi:uncharacterized protein